ncbi:MAG: inositol monophosphatase family protein [Shimia sp.]
MPAPSHIPPDLAAELIATAHACADAARAETLRHFRTPALAADDKDPGDRFDPVTEGDRAAEAAIRALLAARRPHDAILGEEFGAQAGTTGLEWVIDPIDGTRAYVAGAPTWGTLISVADASGPRFGLIDQPHIGERFEGGLGQAQVVGPHGAAPLAVRAARPLAEATLLTTFPEVGTPDEGAAFHRVAAGAKLVRYGLDCYGYALLAAGHVDLVIEAGLAPYDIHAPIAVIEAAGGIVTDWQGGPSRDGGRVIAAASPALHAEALARLAP